MVEHLLMFSVTKGQQQCAQLADVQLMERSMQAQQAGAAGGGMAPQAWKSARTTLHRGFVR